MKPALLRYFANCCSLLTLFKRFFHRLTVNAAKIFPQPACNRSAQTLREARDAEERVQRHRLAQAKRSQAVTSCRLVDAGIAIVLTRQPIDIFQKAEVGRCAVQRIDELLRGTY